MTPISRLWAGFVSAFVLATMLAACSTTPLPAGLTARMDQPGAQLDHAEALRHINLFRASRGVPPLVEDPALTAEAQSLANAYAQSNNRPEKPDDARHIRVSAGYADFAETFSGWRATPEDAAAIADPGATRMGLATAYLANSTYGIHWVMLLAGPAAPGAMAGQ